MEQEYEIFPHPNLHKDRDADLSGVRSSELLDCPFCGVDAFVWKHQNGWKVSCANDCVTMPPRFDMAFSSPEIAKEHWNKRAI